MNINHKYVGNLENSEDAVFNYLCYTFKPGYVAEGLRRENITKGKEKFERYHDRNPRVYKEFVRYFKEAVALGVDMATRQDSHWRIIERVRWESFISVKSEDEYKISNGLIAYYARYFISRDENREYSSCFTLKPLGGHGPIRKVKRSGVSV